MGARDSAATQPTAFGDRLRSVREQAQLTLEDVASETKISLRILTALEQGRFRHLPERIFCRNFIRQVAELAGADPEPLLDDFDEAWDRFQAESGTYPTIEVESEPTGRPIRWRFWLPIGVGVAITIVVAWILIRGTAPAEKLPPDPRRSQATVPEPTRFPTRVPPTPDMLDPTPTAGAEVLATDDAADVLGVEIAVAETSECWVHFRDAAGNQDRRLLNGGDRLQLDLVWPVKLTVGNAGAVTLFVEGRQYEGLGQPGQVVHLELSPDGPTRLGPWGASGG